MFSSRGKLMIELRSITKSFDKIHAVKDLSLVVKPGRITGFLGPNGAGKTTTIRMLMQIIHPDSGSILFQNSPARPPAAHIGYLPEERGLYQKISVLETLTYFASLRGVSDAVGKITRLLTRFELENRAHSKVSELSKGNQQKLQFINTILHDPQFVVLDEPFSGLDPVNQMILKEILEEMRSQGKTIIFSSHQMDQVEKICDDVALINQGNLVLHGDLRGIKSRFGNRSLRVTPEHPEDLQHAYFKRPEIQISGDSALIPIVDGDRQQLIDAINGQILIKSIQVAEPGLEDIFIQQVKGGQG